MRLFTALLVRNEASPDRYLERVLERCLSFSDKVLLLDDRSTDATPQIAESLGCVVRTRKALDSRMWGNESTARSQLWGFALEYATEPDDWILIADADMELHGDPRPLCLSESVNAWAFPLFDMWDSETTYRSDNFWQGHKVPRVWMVRPNSQGPDYIAHWGDRGLHCGHLPANFGCLAGIAPPDVYWLHWGWMQEKHRIEKHEQYLSQSHLLSPSERAHAESILIPPQ